MVQDELAFYDWFSYISLKTIFFSEMMRQTVLLIVLLFTLAFGGKLTAERKEDLGGKFNPQYSKM